MPWSKVTKRIEREIVELTPEYSQAEIAFRYGLSDRTVGVIQKRNGFDLSARGLIGRPGEVDPCLLRQKVVDMVNNGVRWSDIALQAGYWTKTRTGEEYGDATRLKRALGVIPDNKTGKYVGKCRYETILRICEATNIDPKEVGI